MEPNIMARILITNNGKHSPDKWAMVSAEMIFPLDNTALVGERLIAAQKFQTQIAEILSPHHESVMEDEKAKLDDNTEHFETLHNAEEYFDDVIHDIQSAAEATPWAEHFTHPEVIAVIKEIILNHMHTVQHTERLWHATHSPSEHGDRYRKAHGI
jgi:hypothetical protein